jgi:hypothetical protein
MDTVEPIVAKPNNDKDDPKLATARIAKDDPN